MIPVGTLCVIVESPPGDDLLGRLCSVAYHFRDAEGLWHVVDIPSRPDCVGLNAWVCKQCALRPVVPPGDPDAVPHDVSEPELVEVFR